MSTLSRALGVITAAGLLGTGLLATPALAADQPLTVSPFYANNSAPADPTSTGGTKLTLASASGGMQSGGTLQLTLHGTAITVSPTVGDSPVSAAANGKSATAGITLTRKDPGLYDVTLTNPGAGGTVYSCDSCFTITSGAPTITSFGRTSNSGSNPASFTVTGSNYAVNSQLALLPAGTTTADPAVTWATTTKTTTGSTFVGSLTIGAAAQGGAYDVVVTNYDGKKATCSSCVVIPKVTSIVRSDKPAQVPAQLGYGVTHKTLIVSGTGLTASTTFGFSNANGDTNNVVVNTRTFDSATGKVTLDVSVTENVDPVFDTNDTTVPATYNVVALGAGGGYYAKAGVLTVNPRPEFRDAADDSTSQYYFDNDNPGVSQQHFKLTIFGSGIQAGATLAFTPVDGITVNSFTPAPDGTSAVADLDLAASTPLTAHNVVLTNPDLGTPSVGVALTPSAAPVVTSASPSDVAPGTTSVAIRLNGSGISTQKLKQNNTSPASNSNFDYVAPKIVFLDHLGDPNWAMQGSTSGTGSSTTGTMKIPADAPVGPYRIGFLDHNGSLVECKTPSGAACFAIDAVGVSTVTPSIVTNDAVTTMTITGGQFQAGAIPSLERADQPAVVGTNVRNLTATTITADFNLDGIAPGPNAWGVRVTNPDGSTGFKASAVSVSGSQPTITSVSPTSLAAGNPRALFTVNGTNLARGGYVVFNGINSDGPNIVGTNWVSRNKVIFTLDTTGATPGLRTVQFYNTDSSGSPAINCQYCLTITAAPTLSGTPMTPASHAAGSPTFTATISGSGFNGTPTVAFTGGGISTGTSTLGAGGTSFTIPVTVAKDAALSARGFTVTNGDGSQVSCTSCFTVIAAPTVTSIAPNVQKVGTGPTTVTVKGTHFNAGGASVTFSGSGITTGTATVVDAQTITVPVTVAAGASPLGAHDVTVTNTPTTDGGTATLEKAFSIGNVPGVPQNLTATRGDSLVNLTWDAPASDGGLPVTGYSVTVTKTSDGTPVPGASVAVTDTTAQVSGLANGTSYSFTVKATNGAGSGAPTAAATATPATLPGAPTGATATPGDGKATVTWSAPASNGGDPITSYKVYFAPSGTLAGTTSLTTLDVTGLTNGTAYQFYVVALNGVGASSPSDTTAAVTPLATVPQAPTGLTASVTAASGEADLSWTAPPADTLTPISSYNVSVSPASGGNVGTTSYPVDRTATTATVTGLTNGIAYTFTVKAVNGGGTSPASAPATATPYGLPGAVTSLSGSAGNQTVTASWSPPASNGGSAVTGYTATLTPGGTTKTVTTTTVSFTGLTNGTSYTVAVVATNARGDGPSSSVSKTPTAANAAITLDPTPARLLRGSHLVLKGVLTRPDTSTASGNVVLKVRNDHGDVATLATVTPDGTGHFSYDFGPVYNGTYQAQYAGDAANGANASVTRRTLVAARLSASAPTGPATRRAVIYGSVLPNKAGQVVTLYSVSSTGKLTKVTSMVLTSKSTYSFSVPLSRGSHLMQVSIAATGTGTATANDHGEVRFVAKRT